MIFCRFYGNIAIELKRKFLKPSQKMWRLITVCYPLERDFPSDLFCCKPSKNGGIISEIWHMKGNDNQMGTSGDER